MGSANFSSASYISEVSVACLEFHRSAPIFPQPWATQQTFFLLRASPNHTCMFTYFVAIKVWLPCKCLPSWQKSLLLLVIITSFNQYQTLESLINSTKHFYTPSIFNFRSSLIITGQSRRCGQL